MTPNDPIENMKKFIKEMDNHGKTSQHNLWNMTGTVFGIFLTGLSIIATLNPSYNKCIVNVSMTSAIIGMVCVWLCFYLQIQYYSKISRFCQNVTHDPEQDADYGKFEKESVKLNARIKCPDVISKICLIITALGLVFMFII